jgi:hypothetical protein
MSAFLRCTVAALAVVAIAMVASPAPAETINFKASLKASDEVPSNDSKGTGSVTASYDTATKALTWKGTHSGLTGAATMAHFHGPGEPGKNAGVAVWISTRGTPLPSSFEGSATLTDAQSADLMAGRWYVNIHTAANPAGEIRGQLIK